MARPATRWRRPSPARGSYHRVEPLLLGVVDDGGNTPPQIGAHEIASPLQIENARPCALTGRLAMRRDTLSRQAINIGFSDHHTHIL